MQKLLTRISNLIFYNICHICEKKSESLICINCENKFEPLSYKRNLKDLTIFSWGAYRKTLRLAILKLKNGDKELALPFSNILANYWLKICDSLDFSNPLIIPVPSHKKRVLKRGFCQTTLIATEFAKITNLKIHTGLISRIKNTKPMNDLSDLNEREINIKDAFFIEKSFNTKNVLLVDDILTSGTTLSEMTKLIKLNNPESKVVGLTIATGDGV